jgi:PAS domain S-box-containing protein
LIGVGIVDMKLRLKLLIFFVPLYLIAVVVMTVLVRYGVQTIVIQGVSERGLSVATTINAEALNGFRLGNEENLLPYLQAVQENAQALYAIALAPNGRVLAHTNVAEMGQTYQDSTTLFALQTSETIFQEIRQNGQTIMDIAHPIWALPETSIEAFLLLGDEGGQKQRLGTLRMGLPLKGALATADRISEQIFWIITLGSACVLLLGIVFMRNLLRPIQMLSDAAERIGRGQLKETVPVLSSDEIGDLTKRFNQMSYDLAETTVSKAYTDNILRSMNDALVVVSPSGRIENVNAAMCDLVGYEEADLLTRMFTDILVVENNSITGAEVTAGLVWGQTVRNVEYTYRACDGRHIPVLLSGAVLHSNYGHISGTVYAARDITERKNAEAALLESEARFRRLSASAVEGVVLLDGGKVLDANLAMVRILGYEQAEELIGLNGWQFIPKDSRLTVIRKIRNNWQDYFETVIQSRNGALIPVEVIGSRLPNRDHTVGVVAIRDMRQQKKADEAQRQMERGLIQAERMASVGTAAAGIVHNLRSPLTGVMGFTDILLRKYPDIEELKIIETSAKLMADMVDNILTKSRLNRTFEAVDINLLLQRELDFLNADQMFRHQIEKHIDLMQTLPKVWCVYTDLSQVFGNLLRNAVEAMHNSPKKFLKVVTIQKDQMVQVMITDTGGGIFEDNLKNLFDPFFTTKMGDGISSPQGTGLGLYIAKQLLKEYGAKIDVESKEGFGSTFQVSIPIHT